MTPIVMVISFLVATIALIMVLFTFKSLSVTHEAAELGVFTKYLLLKRRYDLLRRSLLFVAAIVIIQICSLLYAFFTAPGFFADVQLLASDIVFLGLAYLLSKLYLVRAIFVNGLEGTITDEKARPRHRAHHKKGK